MVRVHHGALLADKDLRTFRDADSNGDSTTEGSGRFGRFDFGVIGRVLIVSSFRRGVRNPANESLTSRDVDGGLTVLVPTGVLVGSPNRHPCVPRSSIPVYAFVGG